MPFQFNARTVINPSFYEPELVITQAQASGFRSTLAGGELRVRLGPIDKAIYVNRIDAKTQVALNQATANRLPSATITGDYLQVGTYTVRTRGEYNEFNIQEAAQYNVSAPLAQRYAMRQGSFQIIRNACLYGVNPANGEGLLNTPGATTSNLPPDSFGNTTIQTYDNGQLAIFFLAQITNAVVRMYRAGVPTRIVFIAPQRVLVQMELVNVVELTTYQREGAGTATTAQMITEMARQFGYAVEWAYDDTLEGQGANGGDAILLVVPELVVPKVPGINTNEFAKLGPQLQANTLQYADVPVPVEVTTPIVEGVDVTSTMRISPGWCIRSQALTIITVVY